MTTCPDCAGSIMFAAPPRLSEIVECAECAGEFEVSGVDPVTLVPAPEVEEDWGE